MTDGSPVDVTPPEKGSPAPARRALAAGGAVLGVLVRRKELSIVIVTIAAIVYFTISGGSAFNSTNSYHIIMQYFAPWAIIAAGETMLLICGEIDLSAGFVYTFIPFAFMSFYDTGTDVPLALVEALLVAAGIGVLNGVIRIYLGLPSFVTTLGMGFFLEGMANIQSNGSPVTPPITGGLRDFMGGWRWSELVWALAIVLIMQIVLTSTRFGIYTQAAGGNPLSAAESGIKVNYVKIANFTLTSLFAGVAGLVDELRVGSFDPTNGGNQTMFMAVAATVIGGTALLGGSGTVIGALLGAVLLGTIEEGFTLTGVNAFAFDVVIGIAVVVAMFANVNLKVLRERFLR